MLLEVPKFEFLSSDATHLEKNLILYHLTPIHHISVTFVIIQHNDPALAHTKGPFIVFVTQLAQPAVTIMIVYNTGSQE
jgi:hypothetical protein